MTGRRKGQEWMNKRKEGRYNERKEVKVENVKEKEDGEVE